MADMPADHPLFNSIRAALVAGNVGASVLEGAGATLPVDDITVMVLRSILAKVRATEASVAFGWFYKWEATNDQG